MPKPTRKLDLTPTADEKAVKELTILARRQKLTVKRDKLIAAEKRWMRKLRLCTTKLKKNRTAQRRVNKQLEALD